MAMRTIILAVATMFGGAHAQTLDYDYGSEALAGSCPANTEDTLQTLLMVVQTQRNSQAALTTRVRNKMVELGLSTPPLVDEGTGRRLAAAESVSLHLSPDYIEELGSNGAWDDFRLTKGEIAKDGEAAALSIYFKQTTAEQLGIAQQDVHVLSMTTDKRRAQVKDGETQELFIHYQTSDGRTQ